MGQTQIENYFKDGVLIYMPLYLIMLMRDMRKARHFAIA